MFKYIFYLLVLISLTINAQDKYFVYFKDKPVDSSSKLLKNSPEYQEVLNSLAPKAIDRRSKLLGDDILDETDFPINPAYINEVEKLGAQIVWKLKWFNAVSCCLPLSSIDKINALPFVDKVRKVGKFRYKRDINYNEPADTQEKLNKTHSLNYGLSLNQVELSDVPVLHDHGITGKNVLIGLMDAGTRYADHPALSLVNVVATKDFVYGDDDVSNDNDISHGTAVLGMVAGYMEGELISPAYNADFILAKTEDIRVEVNLEEDNFAAGTEWLESQGVDIISTSLGYSEFDKDEYSYTYEQMDGRTAITTKALNLAFQKGVLTISSAGNEGNDPWMYITSPADGFNTIAVGAVTSSNDVASFSSRGPSADGRIKPDVVAMGVSCYSATPSNSIYRYINGTSVSAPIVAGISAQVLSAFPYLDNVQLRQMIIESGDNVETPDNDRGYGLVSAARAVSFPSISEEDGVYTINKMFLSVSDIDPASISIEIFLLPDVLVITELNNTDNGVYSFPVSTFSTGDTVRFRYRYKDNSGILHYDSPDKYYSFIYGQKNVSLVATNINNNPVADNYSLFQNYPNPFNPSTTISFSLPEQSYVKITVFNMLGEKVITLLDESRPEGFYNDVHWQGFDKFGRRVASGPYIYRLLAGNHSVVRKMMFLK